MAITAALVKELRDSTGAGMMDAKKALTETGGDMEAAVDWLRTKGLAKAAKKSGRTAAEGLVAVAVKDGKCIAVEVNSETDWRKHVCAPYVCIGRRNGCVIRAQRSSPRYGQNRRFGRNDWRRRSVGQANCDAHRRCEPSCIV